MSDNESDATPRALVRLLSYLFRAVRAGLVLSTSLGCASSRVALPVEAAEQR